MRSEDGIWWSTWAMSTINWRNLGCKPACFLSLLATGLLRVFKAKVPSFRSGSTMPTNSDPAMGFFFFFSVKDKRFLGIENDEDQALAVWFIWKFEMGQICEECALVRGWMSSLAKKTETRGNGAGQRKETPCLDWGCLIWLEVWFYLIRGLRELIW